MATETELERMVLRLVTDVEGYIRPLKEAVSQTKTAADRVKAYGAQIEKFGRQLQAVGRKMSLYVTAPLIGLGTLASHEFATLEASLAKTIGLVGLSEETVASFRREILALAPAVGKAPAELAARVEKALSEVPLEGTMIASSASAEFRAVSVVLKRYARNILQGVRA